MSLWDFVAAASIATNAKNPDSNWAKVLHGINSSSLNFLNGDSVSSVGGGGRTTNTFGAMTSLVFDPEAVLEGLLGLHKPVWGLLLGPGAVNNMICGNSTTFQYMPNHSQNFTVYYGKRPVVLNYWGKFDGTKLEIFLRFAVLFVFVLIVLGFHLIYSFGGVFAKGIMSPVGNPTYITKLKTAETVKKAEVAKLKLSIPALEEQAQNQKKKAAAERAETATVLGPKEQKELDDKTTEELAATHHKLETAEGEEKVIEDDLKTAERQKEWLLYGNVIAENRGFFVVKCYEGVKASAWMAKNSVALAEAAVKTAQEKLNENAKIITKVNLPSRDSLFMSEQLETQLKNRLDGLEKLKDVLTLELTQAELELSEANESLAKVKAAAK